jgi:hypothetical protein
LKPKPVAISRPVPLGAASRPRKAMPFRVASARNVETWNGIAHHQFHAVPYLTADSGTEGAGSE